MITLPEIIERDKRPVSVTVYMLCYNHGKYIDEALQGVLKQKTNFPINILIHDDASTDNSAEIIRRYAAANPNITAIIEETNFVQNGKSFFPKMVPHMTGKYIAYCECDDFWIDENKLQIQVDYLEKNPDCIATYSNILPVNKFSVHDEAARKENPEDEGFIKTEEYDDYPGKPPTKLAGHQIASLVIRNFWALMKPDEIIFYSKTRANGDAKIHSIIRKLGRIHYFAEEFAAYRRVLDEGDSYSARMAKLGEYDKFKLCVRSNSDMWLMHEYLFDKKDYRKWRDVLGLEIQVRKKYHRSIIKDAQLAECYQLKNIPWHAYIAFMLREVYRFVKRLPKIFTRR